MKKFGITLSSLIFIALLFAVPVYAAKPDGMRGGKPQPDISGPSTLGIDVSYPQCGRTLPNDFAFAIVGVNGGLATIDNPCFAEQLVWAQQANGSTAQDKVQLYVNTANPWDDRIAYNVTTWPIDNIDPVGNDTRASGQNPYDACIETAGAYRGYTNSKACAWQYGWNRAVTDVQTFFAGGTHKAQAIDNRVSTNPQDYVWWLDIETTNSWQSQAANARDLNRITLEGMVDYFVGELGLKVGMYSTSYQFGVIVGDTVTPTSNLYELSSWLAGARNEKDAANRCKTSAGLTAGSSVSLVQFVAKNLDYNVVCN